MIFSKVKVATEWLFGYNTEPYTIVPWRRGTKPSEEPAVFWKGISEEWLWGRALAPVSVLLMESDWAKWMKQNLWVLSHWFFPWLFWLYSLSCHWYKRLVPFDVLWKMNVLKEKELISPRPDKPPFCEGYNWISHCWCSTIGFWGLSMGYFNVACKMWLYGGSGITSLYSPWPWSEYIILRITDRFLTTAPLSLYHGILFSRVLVHCTGALLICIPNSLCCCWVSETQRKCSMVWILMLCWVGLPMMALLTFSDWHPVVLSSFPVQLSTLLLLEGWMRFSGPLLQDRRSGVLN